jgi:hypothetical protein
MARKNRNTGATSTRTAHREVVIVPRGSDFRDENGKPYPKLVIVHARCECGKPLEPICPTYRCPGRRVPLSILQASQETSRTLYAGFRADGSWGPCTEAEYRRMREDAARAHRYPRKRKNSGRPQQGQARRERSAA